MNLSDLMGLWAIRPEVRDAMLLNFDRFLESATPEQIAAVMARGTMPTGTKPLPYTVQNGIAVMRIDGTLTKRPMYSWWGGSEGATYDQIVSGLEIAHKDPAVRAIVTAWDSPGGTVDGAQEAANDLFAMRETGKPMEAVAVGQMCSAAEQCGSAVGDVYASSDTTDMGSIGVLAIHRDYSGLEQKWGIKTTVLSAGKFKGVGWGPLSDSDKEIIQGSLDHSYQIFKQTVARNRGISMDAVEAMAEGRVFKGQKAVEVGLARGIATVGQRVAVLAQKYAPGAHRTVFAVAEPNTNQKQEKRRMDKETLQKEHPELAEAFRAEGRAEGMKTGAENERARIQGVNALAKKVTGCDDLVAEMAYDGKTTPEQASAKLLEAVAEKKGQIVAKVKEDTPPPVAAGSVGSGSVAGGHPQLTGKEWAAKLEAVTAEHAARGITLTPQAAMAIVRKGAN